MSLPEQEYAAPSFWNIYWPAVSMLNVRFARVLLPTEPRFERVSIESSIVVSVVESRTSTFVRLRVPAESENAWEEPMVISPPVTVKSFERERVAAVVRVVRPGAEIVVSVESSLMVFVPELRTMSPVELPPRVRVWELVVPRLPVPVKNVLFAPLPAEMEAVGVPELTFMNANLDEEVEFPPRSRSRVRFPGARAPLFNCQ